MSFSWRLKADSRQSLGHTLRIVDSKVISKSTVGRKLICWDEWPYEPVLYRRVEAGRLVGPAMPELSVVFETVLGERIVYNPYSGRNVSHPNDVAARRVRTLWKEMYGREPAIIVPKSVSQTVDAIVQTCREASVAKKECDDLETLKDGVESFEKGLATPKEAGAVLRQVQMLIRAMLGNESASPIVRPIVRTMYPLALHGESRRPAAFFIVEDSEVLVDESDGTTRISRSNWKHSPSTRQPGIPFDEYEDPKPVIIYMAALGADIKHLLPLAYISDTHLNKNAPPRVCWNSLRDMTMSKYMHASAQAFYLRRYARRVASIWEEKCGRRPAVFATTAVSYNGRPHQKLVELDTDLARVPVSWFSHNEWIRDLEMSRIPREAVERKPSGYHQTERR